MFDFVEAVVTMLPLEVGGRTGPVMPRHGSYQPYVRVGRTLQRVRFIEGPPMLSPGDSGRVVFEVSTHALRESEGTDVDIIELEGHTVGIATILRVLPAVA